MKETFWYGSLMPNKLLAGLTPEELPAFLRAHESEMMTGPRPFAEYMRSKFLEKGVLQQNVFLAADISEGYGYKLISEEKHTVSRDMILRICLAAGFDLNETQTALILYGMAPLCAGFPRDVVFMVVFGNRVLDIYAVNDLLLRCGLPPLVDPPD